MVVLTVAGEEYEAVCAEAGELDVKALDAVEEALCPCYLVGLAVDPGCGRVGVRDLPVCDRGEDARDVGPGDSHARASGRWRPRRQQARRCAGRASDGRMVWCGGRGGGG